MTRKLPASGRKQKANEQQEEWQLPESGNDIFTSPDGSTYKGDWKRFENVPKRHGQGVYHTEAYDYEGYFEEDLFHGQGDLRFSDGSHYKGSFVHGLMTGEGVMEYANGSSYKGQWFEGRMHGIGTFTDKFSRTWTGKWSHGMSRCPIFPQVDSLGDEEEGEEETEGIEQTNEEEEAENAE